MAIIFFKRKINVGKEGCGETGTLVHCWGNIKWCSCCGKVWWFLTKLNIELPHAPVIYS